MPKHLARAHLRHVLAYAYASEVSNYPRSGPKLCAIEFWLPHSRRSAPGFKGGICDWNLCNRRDDLRTVQLVYPNG